MKNAFHPAGQRPGDGPACHRDFSCRHWGGGFCRNNSLCYQDADGDGVCDNHGSNCNYVDTNGDGICDNHGANCNYVDANGDGICDNQGQGYGQAP